MQPAPQQVFLYLMGAGVVLLVLLSSVLPLRAAAQSVSLDDYPLFSDDLHYQTLEASLKESLTYLDQFPAEHRFVLAGQMVSVARLQQTLRTFIALLHDMPSSVALNQALQKNFLVYHIQPTASTKATEKARRSLLLTGYYQPIFTGSLRKNPPYIHPLYHTPTTLVQRQNAQGSTVFGRWEEGRFLPYWTRREIEQGNLLAGDELVWLKDPFDAFTIHVQGSALILCQDDQKIRALRFAAKNGHPYTSIGSYLVHRGKMRRQEVTMDSLRHYLEAHPKERQHILHQNASYIFFSWHPAGPVYGSLNRPLTLGRSVAADQTFYAPGSLLFVRSRVPQIEQGEHRGWAPLQRFVTVQDSGSAIQGPLRLDLFCGTGQNAGRMAGEMKENGELYVLLLKEE